MYEALLAGLLAVFQWPAIGFLLLGVLLGIWLGAVPGLGGIIGLVLLLPFTYGMETIPAFALLLGMFAVTSTSDTIASVMLGIPGTAASQATILDGYPMAQQGKAARAFGAAFTVSAFGGVFGAIILAVSLPLILPIIKSFASPELFVLGLLGLAMVGSLS
ncbi:MAG: tripartite tricarboxylate transporter permease, partial [Rhodospirillales bacterium]